MMQLHRRLRSRAGIAVIATSTVVAGLQGVFTAKVEAANQLTVSVAYADTMRAGGGVPSPWQGSSNVTFVGVQGTGWDAGAVQLQNSGATAVTVSDVSVQIGSSTFDLWGSNTIPAGGSLILTQTAANNFDTSDAPSQVCTNDGLVPRIAVTVAGATTFYLDNQRILNTGGIDTFACNNVNESELSWLGATMLPLTTTSVTAAPNPAVTGQAVTLQASVTSTGGTVSSGTVSFSNGSTNLGTANVTNGSATITTTALPIGSDVVTASYSGSSSFSPSSGQIAETVVSTSAPVSASGQYGTDRSGQRGPKPCTVGEPIVCSIGNLVEASTDLAAGGRGPAVALTRTYNAMGAASATSAGRFGWGWSDSDGASLSVDGVTGNATVTQGDGSTAVFSPNGSGGYRSNLALNPAVNATLVHNGDGTWTYSLPAQELFSFSSTGQLTTVTDRNGEAVTLAYNASGQVASATGAGGRAISFTYNASGSVATATDSSGRIVHYGYDAGGNLASVLDPAGNTTAYAYDASHRLTTTTDPNGGVSTNTYDSSNRVVTQVDPAHRTTGLAYASGANGTHTTTITDPNGNVTVENFDSADDMLSLTRGSGTAVAVTWSYTYDSVGDRIGTTDPNGNATSYTFDSVGNMTQVVYPLGRQWTYAYDAANDPTSITDPQGHVTTITYSAHNDPLKVTRTLTTNGTPVTTLYAYASAAHPGDLASVTDPDGLTTTFGYDAAGDLASFTDPAGDTSTFAYNAIGWRTSAVSPRGNQAGANPAAYTTGYTYDNDGRPTTVTDPLGRVTSTAYDHDGNRTGATDAAGHTTTYTYDADNELTATRMPDGGIWATSYDGDGNVIGQTNPLNATTGYTYDADNRLVAATDPLSRRTVYSYDKDGNVISVLDASNQTTTYAYDADNERTSTGYSLVTTPGVSYNYDSLGRRTNMVDGSGTSFYSYDSLSRLVSWENVHVGTINYTYDPAGKLTAIRYPGNTSTTASTQGGTALPVVSRTYDNAGRMASVTDWSGHTTHFAYDADSDLTGTSYPNGVTESRTYDAAGQVTGISDTGPLGTFLSLPYTYNADSQVATDNSSGSTAGPTDTYSYDSRSRLTGSTIPGAPGTPVSTVSTNGFTYDSADNLTGIANAATSTTLTYDAAQELTTATTAGAVTTTFGSDLLGRRTGQSTVTSTTTYGWNQASDLVAFAGPPVATINGQAGTAVSLSYLYDGDGLLASYVDGQQTLQPGYDLAEGLPLMISDGAASYITGPNGLPVEQITPAGVPLYYHADRLGSTRALTDSAGRVVQTYSYTPYGAPTAANATVLNPFLYAGQYTDVASGLIWMRARWYDPATGQFLTRDPLESLTREPYAYTAGDPLNSADPTGLDNNCDVVPRPWDLEHSCAALGAASLLSNGVESAANAVATPVYAPANNADLACLERQAQAEATGWALPWLDKAGTVLAIGSLLDGEGEAYFAAEGAAEADTGVVDMTFGHGARHLAGTGLNQAEVESTIQTQIQQSVAGASSTGSFWGRVVINGQTIEYRAYTLANGTINVGTYYVVP